MLLLPETDSQPNVAMKDKICRLGCWKGNVTPEEIKGGHSNHNFFVEDGGESFFVRLGHDLDVHCVMRSNELAISRAAHAAGISPEVVWHEPGVMVTRYIQGKTLTKQDIAKQNNLNRLVPLIQKCHRQIIHHIRGPVLMFWVFHVCRNYAAILRDSNHPLSVQLPRLMNINSALEKAVGNIKPVVTHNDLLASNFIDDGEKFWIIDWEYAGFNTALFDLACFCSFCDLHPDQEDRILATYFKSRVTDELRRRFIAFKCASELWTYLWSPVAESHYALDLDYQKIARGHQLNFERLWVEFNQI
ncbi:Thiamine kinase [Desulfobacula phenolica]|uniref:Thiamine kinase n=2 Tax=Desulfobacula phenolica TaxID=90732 RepID=A0A1H2FLJ7_9BACT|nr:Thiamine kinase [Desulfobacula phenolica]